MNKRIIASIVLIIFLISILPGCGKKTADIASQGVAEPTISIYDVAPPELVGVKAEPADGIGVLGVDFAEVATGAADDWEDMPIPFFNPLGSYNLYEYVNYYPEGSMGLEIIEGITTKSFSVQGQEWTLRIPADIDYSLYWLRWYAKEIGAARYTSSPDRSVFSIKENEQTLWWVEARPQGSGAEIRVVKTNFLPAGQALTINPAQWSEEGYGFYTECTPGKLQSATITLNGKPNSGFELRANDDKKWGLLQYGVDKNWYNDSINTSKTDTFVLDDIPITEGLLYWHMKPDNAYSLPDSISFRIDDVADIKPIHWGEAPGAIRLKGVPMGDAFVISPAWATITHEEIDYTSGITKGVMDQNGDVLYVVPSGYYQIEFPSGYYNNNSGLRLVPVSAGEITTVTIPQEMKATVGAMSRLFGDFELNEGGIELLDNTDKGAEAVTSFILNDPLDRDVTLAKEDIVIYEDGAKAAIKSVVREPAGSDVVLVLDSSGSMRENMKPCVDAAARFVEGLPENATIRLVQFNQQVIEHKGEGKEAVLKALSTVKEGGATSLYDATARALEMLAGKKRGYVVVFSDGADSREPGVDGTGSSIAKEQLIEKIKAAGVTVLTIGFEKGHDPATLRSMSDASNNGAYFAAADKTALEGVFASVAGKLGNQFTVTYERPTISEDENSTVPVVSLMIDRSGSMDLPPEPEDDVDYRMDKIKAIFHDFVLSLPKGTLMQAGSFAEPMGGDYPRYDQITTNEKAPILQALGSLSAGGGTPTATALRLAYQSLEPIASSKRVLVFFTDAALQGEETEDGNELDIILEDIRKSGIRVLFAGLANTENAAAYKEIFQKAAALAGGDYVITDSVADIAAKLNGLLQRIDEPQKRKGITFSMGVDCQVADGSRMNAYTSKTLEGFAPRIAKGQVQAPSVVNITTGEKYIIYEGQAAQLLYGGDRPARETRILGRQTFNNKTAVNDFAKLSVTEAYWLNTFKGIDAPSGQYFLALHTRLDFEKVDKGAPEIAYLVPNIFNHFFVSCNEGRMMPASEATWLAEKPFLPPGEEGVMVDKSNSAEGMLVFLIDNFEGNLKQLSLHLYDTAHGHVELLLLGRMPEGLEDIDKLPQTQPAKISDAFSLTINGQKDQIDLAGVELHQSGEDSSDKGKNLSFRVLEATFDSKVQALLDIDPKERFLYQLDTDQGVLLTPMSNIVDRVPLGFKGTTLMAPGSHNAVRMPYLIPHDLKTVQSGIFGDLANASLYIPVTKGAVYETDSLGKTYSHEFFDLTIHSLSRMEANWDKVVLDFTLADKPDGMGTGGLEGVLLMQRKAALGDMTKTGKREPTDEELMQAAMGRKGLGDFASDGIEENMITVDTYETSKLLYGAYTEKGNWGAFDGQKRRGILVFTMPSEDELEQWVLTSSLFPDLAVPISDSIYPYRPLLAERPDFAEDYWFAEALAAAVSAAINEYQATRPKADQNKRIGLSDEEIMGQQVPAPALSLYGTKLVSSVKNEKDFFNIMNAQKWVPSNDTTRQYYFAPEAVLTQGFGSEGDLYNLARVLLTRIGYQPKHRAVRLTEAGMENLRRIGQTEEIPEVLPALAYTDAAGTPKVYVPIFSRDISELSGVCSLMSDLVNTEVYPGEGRITIELFGKLIGNAGMAAARQTMNDIGTILGGEDTADGAYYETVVVFDQTVSMPNMSLDALDISYISTAKSEGGELLLPVLDTRQGLLYDQSGWVDTSNYEFQSVNIRLEAGIDSGGAVHTTILQPGQKLTEVCHTLAWGVPEMTGEAAKYYEEKVAVEAKAAEKPSNYSIARWMGHATIARLVKGMTDFGREAAQHLGITAGRTSLPVAYMVTMCSDGKKAEAAVDLVQHRNQLHSGQEEQQNAYNMMYGAFASQMEAKALPGGEGIHYLDVWEALPDDASLVLLAPEGSEQYEEAVRLLTEKGYPQKLIDRMQAMIDGYTRAMVYIVPDRPAMVNGKMRWAWLEIDQQTYDVVSVFETGERAGMTDYLIGFFPKNWAEVGAGALVGITTSVWGVSAFALETDDYEAIMASAYALTYNIGKVLEAITGITGAIEQMGNVGNMLEGYGSINDRLEKVMKKFHEMAETQWLQPNFMMGYNEAMKAYFGVK